METNKNIKEGSVICSHCRKEIQWYYIKGNKIEDSIYDVFVLPENKSRLGVVMKYDEDGNPYKEFIVSCKCGYDHYFDYDEELIK